MTRIIRPAGPVTARLKAAGYRQYAIILVDDVQVPNVAILSTLDGDKLKFVGHHLNRETGEVTTTAKFVDMKRAATRILALAEAKQPTPTPERAKRPAKRKPPERRSRRQPTGKGVLIDCPGCGTTHRDDTLCPW